MPHIKQPRPPSSSDCATTSPPHKAPSPNNINNIHLNKDTSHDTLPLPYHHLLLPPEDMNSSRKFSYASVKEESGKP